MFAGGFSGSFSCSNVIDIYDADTDTWSIATLSQARRQLSATTVGNKALFAGGDYGAQPTIYSNVVDIYDVNTDTWSTATLSSGRSALAATTVGNKALFAGGTNSSAVVDIYEAETDTWSTTTLSVGRGDLVATTVGNKAMFAGGDAYSDVVDIYNVDTDTWSTATLSQGRTDMSATTLGNKAFFAGGSVVGGQSDVVDIYDIDTDTWSTATLSQARCNLTSTIVGNKALFAGGVSQQHSDVVDIYDGDTDTWYTETLLQARSYLCATTVNNKALFAGGNAGGVYSNAVDIYTISEWTLSLIKPNGGEVMLKGSTYDIYWSGNLPEGNVLLEYSANNGQDWESIVTTEDTGSYEWQIDGPQSNQYLVRVSDANDWYVFDISDSTFIVYTCQEEIAGDLNGNCIVNIVDFAIMAQNWLKKGFVRIFFSPLNTSPEWAMGGQWEFGLPIGNGGNENGNPDPSSGYTGTNIYGVNLNGDYTVAVGGPYCLTTGPFDCSKFHDIKLKFARWLNTDDPSYVTTKVEVSNDGANWHTLWVNTVTITDSNWQVVEYDASETADNEEAVSFRWIYEVLDDRAYPYSGWNVDDIELLGKF